VVPKRVVAWLWHAAKLENSKCTGIKSVDLRDTVLIILMLPDCEMRDANVIQLYG
jgi:hypothetical protein